MSAPEGRIDDVDTIFTVLFEDDEVVELPVEDRAWRQELEVLELELHAASAQPERLRRLQNGEGREPVAPSGLHFADVVEANLLAVIVEHHRQTGRAALGPGQLLHPRNAAATQALAQTKQGGVAPRQLLPETISGHAKTLSGRGPD